jgi:phosphate uptake regulator
MFREILNLLRKDNLQAQALTECHEMIDVCHRMVMASIDSLRNHDDASIDVDITTLDKKLNSFERDVRRKVMTHLSLGNTGDLAAGLVLVSIVIDLERIGDYSKNIYGLARHHPTRLSGGPLEEDLAAIERHSLENFERTRTAFKDANVEDARTLMEDYKDEISRPCAELEERLVSGSVELATADAVTVALYLRCLKRISAHSRNLTSSLVNPFDRIGYPE